MPFQCLWVSDTCIDLRKIEIFCEDLAINGQKLKYLQDFITMNDVLLLNHIIVAETCARGQKTEWAKWAQAQGPRASHEEMENDHNVTTIQNVTNIWPNGDENVTQSNHKDTVQLQRDEKLYKETYKKKAKLSK